ncbi:P2Y purinoceptor 1-like [Saccostrea cucullata]|uniref:P2Y purinoceptor 1-like n=1 Tax=Saccostrea cuccullata TaxID=36930 RepID=UPI002ED2B729
MSLYDVNRTNLQTVYNVIYGYMQNNYDPHWDSGNRTLLWWLNDTGENSLLHNARLFYSYCTPFVIVIGLLGNALSLCVFMTKNLRSLSASTYLSVLSVSDLLTLLFYVTVEWLRRGLVYLDPEMRNKTLFFDENVVCQFQQYMAYVSRLLSTWIVVAFTLERYIGVCWPLLRKIICTKRGTKRIIGGIIASSTIVVLYKPILSAIYVSAKGNRYCTTAENYSFLSFILDSIYAILMSMIPFIVIVVLNILTIRKILSRNKKRKSHNNIVTEESVIRLEFTIILLVVSFCFIAFNVPFFVVWLRTFLHSKHLSNTEDLAAYADPDVDYWQGILYITRTIFNMNYCINFFLYIIAGAYFRREVRMLFSRHSFRDLPYSLCSLRLNTRSNTRTHKTYL